MTKPQEQPLPPEHQPKLRYKLSPELVDGDHWTVVDTKERVLEAVGDWCDEITNYNQFEGEQFEVETVMMTDAEVAALPEI